ncbi:MAG: hypothetical protein AB1489_13765 [Acidobacteriota bacterium]
MKKFFTIIPILILALGLLATTPLAFASDDYLNEQEIERVREAQAIDKRTEVFLRIAERRLNALLGNPSAPPKDKKEKKKESNDDYGPEPTGTPTELLQNYTSVMTELLDKLDDTYTRKKNDPTLPKAIDKLREATQQHLARLSQLRSKINSRSEETALEKAMEIAKMANDGARSFDTQQ